jgi:ribosomal protein L11 methyltransferase
MLLAELAETGFDGFEEREDAILAFADEQNVNEELTAEILTRYKVDFTRNLIRAQNWNHSWESNFEPVLVGNFAGIRADFHPPFTTVEHDLLITPKMSFGTGHHATTYLMIDQMQHLDFNGKNVLDLGTGTGVLAILAEKLGAGKVLAVDNDEWSITNAEENCEKNNCSKVELQLGDSLENIEGSFDIILANINRNVILSYLPAIVGHSHPQTVILLSGLLVPDEETIMYAVENYSLKLCNRTVKENWICLRFMH